MNNSLRHVGVLGMRWGHKKSSSTSSSNKNRKWAKSPIADKAFEEDLDKIRNSKMSQKEKERAVQGLFGAYQINRNNELSGKISKGKQKTDKALQKMKKYEEAAAKRREDTLKEIEYDVSVTRHQQGKKFNEAKHRAMLNKFYKDDLNATAESMRKEKIKGGLALAGTALLVVGNIALNSYINKKYGAKSTTSRILKRPSLPAKIPLDLKFN